MAINYVAELQALQCSVCGQLIELERRVIRDPDKLVDKIDREKQNHKDCKPPRAISQMVH